MDSKSRDYHSKIMTRANQLERISQSISKDQHARADSLLNKRVTNNRTLVGSYSLNKS
jgi:hypothetical protein